MYTVITRFRTLVLLSLCAISLCSCLSQEEKGIVARVNGVPVSYLDLAAQRDILFAELDNINQAPSDSVLQRQFAFALRQLIVQELVYQYLVEKKLVPSDDDIRKEVDAVIADYGNGNFSQMLLEDGTSPELWRRMMVRRFWVNHFMDVVLRPHIAISFDEVKEFYTLHKDDFIVPEQWHFMQIIGANRQDVTKARDSFIVSANATAAQQDLDVTFRDIRMGKDRLPESVSEEIGNLQPLASGKIWQDEESFQTYILLETIPQTILDIGETYKRVEKALLEEKLQAAFDVWVAKRLKQSSIHIASGIVQTLPADLIPSQPEQPQSDPNLPLEVNATEEEID